MTRHRARSTIVAAVVCAGAIQLVLNILVDTRKPEWRDPEFGYRVRRLNSEYHAASRPLAAVLGSSRTEMGLSPGHLDLGDAPNTPLVFNCAQAGCGPLGELLTYHRLREAGFDPRFVLVEVLPPVLSGRTPAEKLLMPEKQSLTDVVRAWDYCDEPIGFAARWAATRAAAWHSYRLTLLSHWNKSSLPWQARQDFLWTQMKTGGWMPYFHEELSDEKRAKNQETMRKDYVRYFPDFQVSKLVDRSYRDLVKSCQTRGVRVAFFIMPESPTFRSWYPPEVKRAVREYLASLRAEFGVEVFDCSEWIDDETAFADGHHLLGHASVNFSARFGRECVAPWLKK